MPRVSTSQRPLSNTEVPPTRLTAQKQQHPSYANRLLERCKTDEAVAHGVAWTSVAAVALRIQKRLPGRRLSMFSPDGSSRANAASCIRRIIESPILRRLSMPPIRQFCLAPLLEKNHPEQLLFERFCGILRDWPVLVIGSRRGARAAEGAGFENQCAGNCTGGSNPPLSVGFRR